MDKDLSKTINIYLSVDLKTIKDYFNVHDPSPLYKKQLSHLFEEYILASVSNAKRHSEILYKIKCTNEIDKKYTEPLMYAIRNHFTMKKNIREAQFKRFKRRNWILLCISFILIILCQGILPLIFKHEDSAESVLFTSMDILSWVILWRPIDTLLFEWNPHLKEISLLNKLSSAEVEIIEHKKENLTATERILQPISQTG